MKATTLVLFRYDLKFDKKDKDFKDVSLDDLIKEQKEASIKTEVVMFICTDTNQTKILSNRYGNIGIIVQQ